MGHSHNPKPPKPTVRRARPRMGKYHGKDVIMCPYCDPPHVISATEPSPCGTFLEINAVQAVFRNQRCALCGEVSGEQIMAGNRFVHIENCTPGKRMYAVPPEKSASARAAWLLPAWGQLFIARKFGKVVMELRDKDNKVAGYTWQTVSKNAQTKVAVSGRSPAGIGSGDPVQPE